MFEIQRRGPRLLILFLLLVLPVLRLLLQHRYGFLHMEVLAAVLLALAAAAAMAELGRWPVLFHTQVIGLSVILSINTIQTEFAPSLRQRWIIAGLVLLLTGAMLALRSKFYPILVMFLAGCFAGDLGKALGEAAGKPAQAGPQRNGSPGHVIHLVFDGMIGLAGLPEECRSCVQARENLETILTAGNFQIYPNAYSNYRGTKDSLSSILNDRLLARTREFVSATDPGSLHTNKYIEKHIQKGYSVRIYQSDYLRYSTPRLQTASARTYRTHNLKVLHSVSMSWIERLRQIGLVYLWSDRVWRDAVDGRWKQLPKPLLTWPLSTQEVWPGALLEDCRAATTKTVFFAHLLTPHFPFISRADGSIRDVSEWAGHGDSNFYSAAEYGRHYEAYGEQLQMVVGQLAGFLDGLRSAGVYDQATIVVHGDHGPRLRLLKENERGQREKMQIATEHCGTYERYDYIGDPELRDLLNRYSTLLAIKPAAASAPMVIQEKGSVLYFFRRAAGRMIEGSELEELNSVYLFEADGSPRAIPILRFWQP